MSLSKWRQFCFVVLLAILSLGRVASGGAAVFSETWESYDIDNKPDMPIGDWTLVKGHWGKIAANGHNGGKFYFVRANTTTRIRHKVDLSPEEDIVLQGWLFDSGETINRSMLGLTDEDNSTKNAAIRIGPGAPGNYKTYTIVFSDPLQSEKPITVDTKMPCEEGWHFMRLEIKRDRSVSYQVWNAAQTIENKGTFGWTFDRAKLSYVTIGAVYATPGPIGWDDIKVGSIKEIGPAPRLPTVPAESTKPKP